MGEQSPGDTMVAIVLGTRPEIIKLSPLVHECERQNIDFIVIHTGQHYSDSLDTVFFEQLEVPTPDYNLGVGSGSHGKQTGEMLINIEKVLLEEMPDIMVVQGDTNSALAGAVAASKTECQLAHVEAGLRSFDRDMPEETNRVLADHVSDFLFAPTEQSRDYLLDEGRPDKDIYVTGNTIVDALYRHRELARKKSNVFSELGITDEEYFLMTAHRAENVDNESRFRKLLSGVANTAAEHDVSVLYPAHPRAQERIEDFDIDLSDRIRLTQSQDYLDFLRLEAGARLILTDSGGVQEEACVLQVPCVTLRDNTERPETVEVGANRLSGVDPEMVQQAASEMLSKPPKWENPFGSGETARKILDVVIQ